MRLELRTPEAIPDCYLVSFIHRTTCCISDNCLRFHTMLEFGSRCSCRWRNRNAPPRKISTAHRGNPGFLPVRSVDSADSREIFRAHRRQLCLVLSRPVVASSSKQGPAPARLFARSKLSWSAAFIQLVRRIHTTHVWVRVDSSRSEREPSAKSLSDRLPARK